MTAPYFSTVKTPVQLDFFGKSVGHVIQQLNELKQEYQGRVMFFSAGSSEDDSYLELLEFHKDRIPQDATHFTLPFNDINCLTFYKVRDVAGHPTWFQYRVGTKPGTFEWMHQGDHRNQFLIPLEELDRVLAES